MAEDASPTVSSGYVPEPLRRFVEEIRWPRLSPPVYALIGIPLVLGNIGLIFIIYDIIRSAITQSETLVTPYQSFIAFYLVYTLASSVAAYQLMKVLSHHLVYSGVTMYYWGRRSEDYNLVISVLRSSVQKKRLPSPVTMLLVNLVTGGAAYPVALYLFEKEIKSHAVEEESALGLSPAYRKMHADQLLIDLAATIVTLGAYMVYWGYRAVSSYTIHLATTHASHPEPPVPRTTTASSGAAGEHPVWAGVVGLVLFTTGYHSLLAYYGYPTYPIPVLGFALLFAYLALHYRRLSYARLSAILLAAQYAMLLGLGYIGLVSYPHYVPLLEQFREGAKQLTGTRNFQEIFTGIYRNNALISMGGMIPLLGPAYMGYAVSNTGFIYGLILGDSFYRHSSLAPLTLLVMPHTLLELGAYALIVAAAAKAFHTPVGLTAKRIIIGFMVLLIAGLVETATILIS